MPAPSVIEIQPCEICNSTTYMRCIAFVHSRICDDACVFSCDRFMKVTDTRGNQMATLLGAMQAQAVDRELRRVGSFELFTID